MRPPLPGCRTWPHAARNGRMRRQGRRTCPEMSAYAGAVRIEKAPEMSASRHVPPPACPAFASPGSGTGSRLPNTPALGTVGSAPPLRPGGPLPAARGRGGRSSGVSTWGRAGAAGFLAVRGGGFPARRPGGGPNLHRFRGETGRAGACERPRTARGGSCRRRRRTATGAALSDGRPPPPVPATGRAVTATPAAALGRRARARRRRGRGGPVGRAARPPSAAAGGTGSPAG